MLARDEHSPFTQNITLAANEKMGCYVKRKLGEKIKLVINAWTKDYFWQTQAAYAPYVRLYAKEKLILI